jgi:D-alanyl-D-alanine carboxypeptidase
MMTDSQRRRRPAVGQRRDTTWKQLNILAIGAVAAGFIAVVSVIFVAIASDGGDGGGPAAVIGTATPTAEPGNSDTTAPAGQTVTETPPSNGEPVTVACGDILAPMDKQHRLPADCVPPDLRDLPAQVSIGNQRMRVEAAAAFEELAAEARRAGYTLASVSAYRSYQDQVAAYEANRQQYGDEVDRVSAKPGFSEHQLGTTTDVSSPSAGYGLESFEGTAEAAWLATNSWRFGFIVSYPDGKESVTGYAYEPWHIRYVGRDVAAKVHQSGLTLHEYLLQSR